ncbi:MAG: hypothetical protein ACUVT7_05365 [Thermoplasmata archaeon]
MSDSKGWAMVFGFGRKDPREKRGHRDQKHVPYRLATYEHDYEGKRFRSSNVVYSFWSASKYVLILSLMLWWLPMFGQMIAGYVGGRRAGGPWKGVAAAIFPVVCLYVVMTGFDTGVLPSHIFGVAIAPAAIGTSLQGVPLISPYLQFSSEYVGAFVQALAGSSPYGINMYVLTVAFAYVGGVLAEQNRREIEFNSGSMMANTTVLVTDSQAYPPQLPEPAPQEAWSGIGAMFHWPRRHYTAMSAGFSGRRRDAWSRAAPMRYEDVEKGNLLPAAERDVYVARDDFEFGQPRSRKLKNHPQKEHWHHKQKRRGRPNFSAKPRFEYPQYDIEPERDDRSYDIGFTRRSKQVHRMTVPPDPKFIRRAKKMIDSEWGRRKYPRFVDADEPSYADVEAEPVVRHKREHATGHSWDTI